MKVGDLVRLKNEGTLKGVIVAISDCGYLSDVVRILTLNGTTTTLLIEDLEAVNESR